MDAEELVVTDEVTELAIDGGEELVMVDELLELLEVVQQGPPGPRGVPGTGAEDVAVLSWLGV